MPRLQRGCVVLLLTAATACGGSTSTSSPTPTPAPAAATFSLSGTVVDGSTSAGIAGATVTIADGPNAARATTTDSAGNYTFTGLQPSGFTVNVSASLYVASSKSVTLTSNQTLALSLTRVPPSTFTVNGSLTDGTSGGVLPNIGIQITDGANAGKSATTDERQLQHRGVAPGTFTMSPRRSATDDGQAGDRLKHARGLCCHGRAPARSGEGSGLSYCWEVSAPNGGFNPSTHSRQPARGSPRTTPTTGCS